MRCLFIYNPIAQAVSIPPVGPGSVPGKEYSDNVDKDAAGVADPHQNLWWDGVGGVANTFDYTGAAGYPSGSQVDALANRGDALFHEVISDQVTMVTSFTSWSHIEYTAPVAHAPVHATPPKVGTWARDGQINGHNGNLPLPDDVDGLEIWGPPGPGGDDADRFSLINDPLVGAARVSVWAYNSGAHIATPYITALQIATAIDREDLATVIDLDAMMTWDEQGDDYFGPGDSIMFSIAPLAGFDGGEIWVWNFGAPANFLVHGGEVWNTAHVVGGLTGHFSNYNDCFGNPMNVNENINALEALPEPATVCLLGLGGLLLRRRKRV